MAKLFIFALMLSFAAQASAFTKCYNSRGQGIDIVSGKSTKSGCPTEVSRTVINGLPANNETQITYGNLVFVRQVAQPSSGVKEICVYNMWGATSQDGFLGYDNVTCEK